MNPLSEEGGRVSQNNRSSTQEGASGFVPERAECLDLHDECDTLWQMTLSGVAGQIHVGNTGSHRS